MRRRDIPAAEEDQVPLGFTIDFASIIWMLSVPYRDRIATERPCRAVEQCAVAFGLQDELLKLVEPLFEICNRAMVDVKCQGHQRQRRRSVGFELKMHIIIT